MLRVAKGLGAKPTAILMAKKVSFQRKNPDFQSRNPDLLLRNPDFLLKNVDFIIKKMGEPIEHWDQILTPDWGESLPVLIQKDGERSVTDWSPKRKTVGSGEREYVVKKHLEEPKAAVPRRNLPRYIVKAKVRTWCLVLGAWCWLLAAAAGCLVLGAWRWLLAAGCWVLGAWCLVLGAWCLVLGARSLLVSNKSTCAPTCR